MIADTRYDQSRTVERRVGDLDPAWAGILRTQRREGEARLAEREAVVERITVKHAAEISYTGQIHMLRMPVEADWTPTRMDEAFREVYRREYGNAPANIPVLIVSMKTSVRGIQPGQRRRATSAVQPM